VISFVILREPRDRRISKYEMLRFAMHDKKMQGGHEPTNSLEKNRLSEPYWA